MIMLKLVTLKSGLALMMLAIWIGVDGFAAVAGAQMQPPRRKRRYFKYFLQQNVEVY